MIGQYASQQMASWLLDLGCGSHYASFHDYTVDHQQKEAADFARSWAAHAEGIIVVKSERMKIIVWFF